MRILVTIPEQGAASGVIFSAVYALTLYRNVMFGEITNPVIAG